jgi:acetyltransferase-like isoleucine patch superfamily enzyme
MILKNVKHRLRLALTNARVALRHDVLIEKGVTIKYDETLDFGARVTLQSGVYLYGSRTMVLGEGGVTIGDYTHLGPGVVVTSQYGDATAPMETASPTVKTAPVRIGRGSWIGSRAVIMPGATIGDRTVVAPGSVVYGRFGDGLTLSGNPARPVRPVRPRGPQSPAPQPNLVSAEGAATVTGSSPQ